MIEKMVIVPVICGILALMVFFLYLYSANHAPYRYTDIISLYPLFSFVGLLISIITIKEGKSYSALWSSGVILCTINSMMCILGFGIISLI